jgi:hypothetical protein
MSQTTDEAEKAACGTAMNEPIEKKGQFLIPKYHLPDGSAAASSSVHERSRPVRTAWGYQAQLQSASAVEQFRIRLLKSAMVNS